MWDKTERKFVPRTQILEGLARGEWPGAVPDPESIQAMATDDVHRRLTEKEHRKEEEGLKLKHLMEQAAKEEIGLSGRGQKRVRRHQREDDKAFQKALETPKDVVTLRIVDDEELPP